MSTSNIGRDNVIGTIEILARRDDESGAIRFDIASNGQPVYSSAVNATPEHTGEMAVCYLTIALSNAARDPETRPAVKKAPCYCDYAFHPHGH